MTVALVLATQPDVGLRGQLTALGVRRVDAAEQAGPGLLTVAAEARAAGERVLICVGDDSVPEEVLARLLDAGASTVYTGLRIPGTPSGGALVVDTPDLDALAGAAQSLAARHTIPAPSTPGELTPAPLAPGELGTLLGELTRRGVTVRLLDVGPDSAGADPGPACYARGGTQPTVTDADGAMVPS